MATPEKLQQDEPGRDESRPYERRKGMRLRHYDYSQAGAYFVTICTHGRACILGEISGALMVTNEIGRIVESIWQEIPEHYSSVAIDAFVVMPNHVHGILFITAPVGARFIAPDPTKDAMNRAPTLGEVVRAFKARCSHAIHKIDGTHAAPIWQRNYYEHIIRDDNDCMRIREYIANNPAQWALDEENPELGLLHQGAMNRAPRGISLD